jgi:LDH2 family malate/lactate/ureidoglycolate dehydrogenase
MAKIINRIPAIPVREFCTTLFEKLGVSRNDAWIVADSLVEADLRGVESHGVTRVGIYVERLEANLVNPRPQIAVVRETPTVALLDGDNGFGAVIGVKAMDEAIRRTKEYGTAWVGVRNSNHFGAAAHYAMRAINHQCIGLAMTNAPATTALWGGKTPFLGTNPFAIALPAGTERPIVLDMATSITARGKIILAAKKGESIPVGLAIDPEGRPTTDPHAALEGAILPFGGHKGYGISFLVDVLSGVMTGATFAPHVGPLYDNPEGTQNLGHGFSAILIDALMPFQEFSDRMDQLIREVRNAPRAVGVERIFLPGEIEFETEAQNKKEGIPLSEPTVKELKGLGKRLGVSWPFDA